MDGFVRDALVNLGGPWPIIGVPFVVAVVLGWAAYKAHENDSQATWFLGAACVGALVAVGIFGSSEFRWG